MRTIPLVGPEVEIKEQGLDSEISYPERLTFQRPSSKTSRNQRTKQPCFSQEGVDEFWDRRLKQPIPKGIWILAMAGPSIPTFLGCDCAYTHTHTHHRRHHHHHLGNRDEQIPEVCYIWKHWEQTTPLAKSWRTFFALLSRPGVSANCISKNFEDSMVSDWQEIQIYSRRLRYLHAIQIYRKLSKVRDKCLEDTFIFLGLTSRRPWLLIVLRWSCLKTLQSGIAQSSDLQGPVYNFLQDCFSHHKNWDYLAWRKYAAVEYIRIECLKNIWRVDISKMNCTCFVGP